MVMADGMSVCGLFKKSQKKCNGTIFRVGKCHIT